MPKVSVIIPAYNCASFVNETIDSILNQTYQDFEIILVDDGSTDNTKEVVRKYGDKIKYLYQQNSGVSAARNKGIGVSRGKYIAFLDHDDLWLPERLEKQVKFLDENPEVPLVFSDSYCTDWAGSILERSFEERSPHRGSIFNELFIKNFIPTQTVLVRKEIFNIVGNFNPQLKVVQDYDLWLRIAERFQIDYINQPLAKHRVHEGSFSKYNVDIWAYETFSITNRWLQKRPELKDILGRKLNQKLAKVRWYLAHFYLFQGRMKEARAEFVKSFIFNKFLLKSVILYIATFFLDVDSISKLRMLKRNLNFRIFSKKRKLPYGKRSA